MEIEPLADLWRPPGAAKSAPQVVPTEEIGWSGTQEIGWSSTEETGFSSVLTRRKLTKPDSGVQAISLRLGHEGHTRMNTAPAFRSG
jgi:hypothetical protein